MTISKLFKAFSPSFRSLDLRIASVKTTDGWMNVVTSLFPSNKPFKEIELEQQRIRSKLSKEINQKVFNIFLAPLSFEKLYNVSQQIMEGGITVNHVLIRFRKFDLITLRVDHFLPDYLKGIEEWRLFGGEGKASAEDRKHIWSIIDDQEGATKLLGYAGIYDLINEILGIRKFDRGQERDLVIGVPTYARLVEIDLKGSLVEITTRKHVDLDNLQLNLFLNRLKLRAYQYETVQRITKRVEECKRPFGKDFCCIRSRIQITDMQPHDRINVTLINRDFPSLEVDRTSMTVPLKNAVEPFSKTLLRFCPLEKLEQHLLNPEQCTEKPKKTPDKIFERAVSWLLSLAGFSVISLGKQYEKLTEPTKYEIGSVDIIAYRENKYLLLVDCDTKIPDDKKIGSLLSMKEYFRFIQDEHKEPTINPVIFSPRDCEELMGKYKEITIVDRSRIKWLLENAMLGKLEEIRFYLATRYVYDV